MNHAHELVQGCKLLKYLNFSLFYTNNLHTQKDTCLKKKFE